MHSWREFWSAAEKQGQRGAVKRVFGPPTPPILSRGVARSALGASPLTMRVPATAVAHAVLLLFALHQCLSTFVDTVRLSKSVTMPPIHRIHKPQRAPEPVEEESVPVPCDTIPTFQQVWDGYVPDHLGMHAAVFTPYHITPGGGEKYLLSIVQALQFAGYSVIVYTYRGNSCTSKQKLLETAASLRVDLRADMLDLQLWHPSAPPVRIFFALGNEKFPQVRIPDKTADSCQLSIGRQDC